jgi:type IV pilus assembly protein PilE
MRKQSGFTLIELMIALVVVAILTAIALPAYNSYVTRGKIPDATSGLAAKRVKMEQFFQDNRTYVGAPAGDLDQNTSKYFDFTAVPSGTDTRTTNTYTLYAIGKNSMTGFQYSVDQSNSKSSTVTGIANWTGNSSCWVIRTGGQC